MQGEVPPLQAALDLYHILSESDTDLRQPVGLEKQLLTGHSLDADVGQSMLLMLQVLPATCPFDTTALWSGYILLRCSVILAS